MANYSTLYIKALNRYIADHRENIKANKYWCDARGWQMMSLNEPHRIEMGRNLRSRRGV